MIQLESSSIWVEKDLSKGVIFCSVLEWRGRTELKIECNSIVADGKY